MYEPPANLSDEDKELERSLVSAYRKIIELTRAELATADTESALRLWRYHLSALLREATVSLALLERREPA